MGKQNRKGPDQPTSNPHEHVYELNETMFGICFHILQPPLRSALKGGGRRWNA